MQEFMDFWEHIASWQRIVILLGGMILFWVLEGYYPLFSFSWKRYRHAGINLFFLSTTVLLNLIFGVITLWVCSWVTRNEFGLMYHLAIPLWAKVVLWLMLMDFFSQYLPHYMMHKV